jgi:hypothetical protein
LRKSFIILSVIFFSLFSAYAQEIKVAALPDVMNEISGIATASNKKLFAYLHNDSGDTSRIFAIDNNGKWVTTLYFKGISGKKGVTDCEDIASGKDAYGKGSYIYLGDIGDNGAKRNFITVYRIPEPARIRTPSMLLRAQPVFLQYPDGPRDAETLMIDDIDHLLYIISKRQDTVSIYTSPLLWEANDTIKLQKRGTCYFTGVKPGKWISGGDISRDGKKVILKSYQKVFYWHRENNEPVWLTLQKTPVELPYKQEPQGEAICFDNKGNGYYTVSEGDHQPVYYYKLDDKGK